jgi:hypothetical protein
MAGVQFFGKDAVVNAFNHSKVETWGIFQGKTLMATGSGSGELISYLDMLAPAGGNGIYTLKVYRGVEEPEEVTDKMECNASFNFKLNETPMAAGAAVGGFRGGGMAGDPIYNEIYGTIQKEILEAWKEKLSSPPKEKASIGALINQFIEEPERLVELIGSIKELFNPAPAAQPYKIAGMNNTGIAPAATTNHSTSTMNTNDISPEQKMQRIAAALDILEKHDPKILEHLEALAALAVSDPFIFKQVIKKFDLL